MRRDSISLDHFEALYEKNADPWRFASSAYEKAKYEATLAALPRDRYAHALDIGCSIGVFTAALAPRCDDLLAIEPVEAALNQARERCADQPWVRFGALFVPVQWPNERFDLIVISEVLDYLGADDVVALAARVHETLAPGGDLVLVHWVRKKGAVKADDEASDRLIAILGEAAMTLRAERNADYRLDVIRRA